jgi:hypothetical protein
MIVFCMAMNGDSGLAAGAGDGGAALLGSLAFVAAAAFFAAGAGAAARATDRTPDGMCPFAIAAPGPRAFFGLSPGALRFSPGFSSPDLAAAGAGAAGAAAAGGSSSVRARAGFVGGLKTLGYASSRCGGAAAEALVAAPSAAGLVLDDGGCFCVGCFGVGATAAAAGFLKKFASSMIEITAPTQPLSTAQIDGGNV